MKRILSICLLWIGCLTLWGQSSGGGYGGDYNPSNPNHPNIPPSKYRLTVIATEGGRVDPNDIVNERYTEGTSIYLRAYKDSKYRLVHWIENDSIIVSNSSEFWYYMPARDVVVKAVFEYYPGEYGGNYDPSNPNNPSATVTSYKLTAKTEPANIGNVYTNSSRVNVGEEAYVSASQHSSYKFKGWFLDGVLVSTELHYRFLMEDHNMDFTAKYEYSPSSPNNPTSGGERLTYNVYYQIDGHTYLTESLTPGKKIVLPDTPIRKGCTFNGWKNAPEVMPRNDVYINGTFSANTYTIKFVVEGKTITRKLVYGTKITPPEMGTLEGSTFRWIDMPTIMPDCDIVVTGEYTPLKYALIYMVDGVEYRRFEYKPGETLIPIPEPAKEGYVFSGWSSMPAAMPNSYFVVNGYFVDPTLQRYRVTYVVNDEVYRVDSITPGSSIAHLNLPYKEGHTFNIKTNLPIYMPASDLTIEGEFSINSYKLTYVVDGITYKEVVYNYGDEISMEEPPAAEGSAFSGWNDLPKTMPARNLTLTGSYVINGYTITYMLDNEVYKKVVYTYGTTVTPMGNLVKEGYTFSGWSESPTIMPARDMTITASFTLNKYALTYWVDGKVHQSDTLGFEAPITPLAEPVNEGYTFSGWSEIPDSMPSKDVMVIGTFAINSYRMTYVLDGEIVRTDTIEYNKPIILMESPVKEGYSFSGWGDIPQTMPARNIVASGTLTINKYQIAYVVEGDTIHTDYLTYNEQITPIDYPEREGFTFSGWIGIPVIMPASDVTTAGEFFIKTTQTDAQGLMYTMDETTETFEISNYDDSMGESIVIPTDLYGYPVSGIKNRALMGAENLISVIIPGNVTKVGYRAFYGCNNLSYIEWKTTAPVDADCFDEPARHGNLLVYVENEATEVTYQGNVIVNGVAEKITISNDQPFRNIREFTARNISFTREFSKRTKIGEAGGWEAIIIPFDVETIVSENRGELKPFGVADFNTSLPYWIAELQADGSFAYIETIKANSPFIMEVPNSDEYRDIYNVEGMVTFSAENTTVHSTDITLPTTQGYAMMGSYEGTTSDSRTYALNDEEYTAGGVTSMAGSVFVANSRDIRPFEAYVYSNQVAPAPYLRIGSDNATGIGHQLLDLNDDDAWYTLQGVRLNGRPIEKGAYIHGNKVEVIK